MSIIDQLATSLNRRDEAPNIELAASIADSNNKKAVRELIDNLDNKKLQNDCIKVLYEVAAIKPALIIKHVNIFLSLLGSKNNRLQWGAMTVIDAVTLSDADAIYNVLPQIIDAADSGSVITRDHAVSILIRLCSIKQYTENCFALLIEQLLSCPTNQLPMYAEHAAPIVTAKNKQLFIQTLQSRIDEVEKESKKKRIEKVIKNVSKY